MPVFETCQTSESEIIQNKRKGVIYVADFPGGAGKYISITEAATSADIDIKVSSRIHLRITYIANDEKISGVELAKVHGSKVEKVHFSTLDFERILQLLGIFSELDLKAIANKSVVLDESIIGDMEALSRFLRLIATDPQGRVKLGEVVTNYGLIGVGDINGIAQRKSAVELFRKILNDQDRFRAYKADLGAGKDEEVWQKFFSQNSWILGSDLVEILEERRIDIDNIADYLVRSFDGFVDIVELKTPNAQFWKNDGIPKSDLMEAIMQCSRYVLQAERRMNDYEFSKRIQDASIVKPRITLIYGRSNTWSEAEKESYRVLNSSYTTLNIMTYDHLLERAQRLAGDSVLEAGVADSCT